LDTPSAPGFTDKGLTESGLLPIMKLCWHHHHHPTRRVLMRLNQLPGSNPGDTNRGMAPCAGSALRAASSIYHVIVNVNVVVLRPCMCQPVN